MTGPALPPGPPFSADVVADLHAGAYPETVADVLRRRIAADPEAAALLAALESTVSDLAAWRDPTPIPMPAAYAARLDAAIAAESAARASVARGAGAPRVVALPAVAGTSAGSTPVLDDPDATQVIGASPTSHAPRTFPAPARLEVTRPEATRPVSAPAPAGRPPTPSGPGRVSSLDEARSRRTRRWATGLGVAAAIAAVVTIGAVVLRPSDTGNGDVAGQSTTTTGAPATSSAPVGPTPTQQAIVADPKHLERLLSQITGTATAGPYADPARLSACLAANGVKGTNVLGVAAVSFEGAAAYAISLGLDEATAKILIVGDSCGAPGPDLRTSQTTGR